MVEAGELFSWLLATFRASALLLMMPFFVMRSVPRIMRVGFAAMLAWVAVPHAGLEVAPPAGLIEVVLLVAKELAIGLLMGLAVRMMFFILDFTAQILAVEIGINPSPEFDVSGNAAGNPLGTGLFYLGAVIFFAGAHYAVFFAFARSFELVPPGLQEADAAVVPAIVAHSGRIFALGTLMAAPVMAVNFLVNLTFSLLGRVVPRMNVFILSFSARIAAGLAMLGLSVGLIAHHVNDGFGEVPELMLRFLPFAGR